MNSAYYNHPLYRIIFPRSQILPYKILCLLWPVLGLCHQFFKLFLVFFSAPFRFNCAILEFSIVQKDSSRHNPIVCSVVEWLTHRTDDQHGLGSKPSCAILVCSWERHFTVLSPAWRSWQAVLYYSNISTKLLADSNILASPEAGRGNCLPYV